VAKRAVRQQSICRSYLPNIRTHSSKPGARAKREKGISSPLQFSAKLLLGWHSTPQSLLQTSTHWGIREHTPAQSIIPFKHTTPREGVSHKKEEEEGEGSRRK
jgi:hypothetical protein